MIYIGHAAGNAHRGQVRAAAERTCTNTHNTFGDFHGNKKFVIRKCIRSDFNHRKSFDHRGNAEIGIGTGADTRDGDGGVTHNGIALSFGIGGHNIVKYHGSSIGEQKVIGKHIIPI